MKELLSDERGQSLIGILIVAAIGALLAWYLLGGNGTSGSNSNPRQTLRKSREAQSQQDISLLRRAIKRYRMDNGKYPPDLQTLVDEDYVSGGAVKAPNGNRYDYNPQTGSVSN